MNIGTKMAESTLGPHRCRTGKSGWLQGTHPQVVWEEESMCACFDYGGSLGDCYYTANIRVTNCSDYYVYYLEDTPGCYDRYCAI